MSFKDKMYKIWAGEYSNEGFEYGLKDGKDGKPKNKLKFFSASNPVNWFWAFENAFDSFSKHYDVGYVEGEKVRHHVYSGIGKINLKGGGENMANTVRNYDDAMSNLRMLKSRLISVQGEFRSVKVTYEEAIQTAQGRGWMKNYIDVMLKKQEAFSKQTDVMIELIETIVNKIDRDIKGLNDLKEIAAEN